MSNPDFVADEDCEEFIMERGKGWVCETDGKMVGFSIADPKENNIRALFVHHDFEKQGIGRTTARDNVRRSRKSDLGIS